jgi:hypothetical protein
MSTVERTNGGADGCITSWRVLGTLVIGVGVFLVSRG